MKAATTGNTLVTFFNIERSLHLFPEHVMYHLNMLGHLYRRLSHDWDIIEIAPDAVTKDGLYIDVIKYRKKIKVFYGDSVDKKPSSEGFKKRIIKNTKKYDRNNHEIIVKERNLKSKLTDMLNNVAGDKMFLVLANVAIDYVTEKHGLHPRQKFDYALVYTREKRLYLSVYTDLSISPPKDQPLSPRDIHRQYMIDIITGKIPSPLTPEKDKRKMKS